VSERVDEITVADVGDGEEHEGGIGAEVYLEIGQGPIVAVEGLLAEPPGMGVEELASIACNRVISRFVV
jgi:hypothetical protein